MLVTCWISMIKLSKASWNVISTNNKHLTHYNHHPYLNTQTNTPCFQRKQGVFGVIYLQASYIWRNRRNSRIFLSVPPNNSVLRSFCLLDQNDIVGFYSWYLYILLLVTVLTNHPFTRILYEAALFIWLLIRVLCDWP